MAKHMAKVEKRRGGRWVIPVVVVAVLAAAGLAVWLLLFRGAGSTPAADASAESAAAAADGSATSETDADASSVAASDSGADASGNQADEDKDEGKDGAVSYKTELAAQFAAGKIESVRLIGDSITHGFGTNNYVNPNETGEGNVIYDDGAGTKYYESAENVECWANAFRTWAGERGVKSFVNAGINGAYMWMLYDNPDAWLGDGADVVFVALGTNDAGVIDGTEFGRLAETALSNVAKKCKYLVVVSPVNDLRPESMLVQPAASFNEVLRPLCEENGYLFVDASEAVSADQFVDDGLHPNTEGSMAIWACIQETLGLK